MSEITKTKSLKSRVIKTAPVKWKDFHFIQQDDFKDWTEEAKNKLKQSIIDNEFTQPFYVWEDESDEVIYCLDGKHRVILLEELEAEGKDVPELLDATFIDCENKNEAAKLVLIYSSLYAKTTQKGLFDFIQMYDIEYSDIKQHIDLPDFSIDRFEQKFDIFPTDSESDDALGPENNEEVIVSPGDLFEINGHRIICGSFKDEEVVGRLMEGKKARIVNCDPPYNLPTNFFREKEGNLKDFAMGSGEMSDEEFVEFLALIMRRSVENTVKGGIHYIFMDWRHIWHITEAGRRVYGRTIPKQMCVWNKDVFANGAFYRSKHELCFIFNDESGKALWNRDLLDHGGFYKDNDELCFIFKAGEDKVKHLSHLELKDRIRTNVWNYPSGNSRANPDRYEMVNHPTPKPTALIKDAILDTTNEGDIVIDWFLGSGTCLLACAQSNRICYGTEIEPEYVQLEICRYLRYCEKSGIVVNFVHENGSLTANDFNYEQQPNQ